MKVKCKICSKEILVSPSRFTRTRYCSKNCQNIGKSNRWKGNKLRVGLSPPNKGTGKSKKETKAVNKPKLIICNQCGTEFLRHVCHIHEINFCSKKCSDIGRVKRPKVKIPTNCLDCGKKLSLGAIRCGHCCKAGSHSWKWRGGITPANTKIRLSKEYMEWRKTVFARDNYKCTICGETGHWNKEKHSRNPLHVDHIKPFSIFPELRMDINNARILCKECHKLTDTYGRNYKQLLVLFNL